MQAKGGPREFTRVNVFRVETIRQLGDTRGDLVELNPLLAAIALYHEHSWSAWTCRVGKRSAFINREGRFSANFRKPVPLSSLPEPNLAANMFQDWTFLRTNGPCSIRDASLGFVEPTNTLGVTHTLAYM